MFASKETMEERAEINKAEWRKAKSVWKRFGVFLIALLMIVALFMAYLAGDVNGQINCISLRPERDATP